MKTVYVVTSIYDGGEFSEMIGDKELANQIVSDFLCLGVPATMREVCK